MTSRGGGAPWDADVIVLGTGAWGSMTAWALAEAGADVLALDRHVPPHAEGSSHGRTRLFRTLCLEHPGLTPLAELSAERYRRLDAVTGTPVLDLCGGLTIGAHDGRAIRGVITAASKAGIGVQEMDSHEVRERFPFHTGLSDRDVGVFDPRAGILWIERAVGGALRAAASAGATLRTGVTVGEITPVPGGYRVSTDQGSYAAPKIVAAMGSWTKEHLPQLPLKLTRLPMTWFETVPGRGEDAHLVSAGAFIREIGEAGGYWGHGAPPGEPAKVGPRGAVARGDEVSVSSLDRLFHAADAAPAVAVVEQHLPSLDARSAHGVICHSTRTPDEQFILGELPQYPGLIVAAGESGHGGKHSAGIGALAAALVCEQDIDIDIGFMSPARFGA